MDFLSRFLKFIAVLFLLALIVLFFQFNVSVMHLAESFVAHTGWIAFLALTVFEAAGFVMLYLAWRPAHSKLVLRDKPTPVQKEIFVQEMKKRLEKNSIVLEQKLSPAEEDFVPRAMSVLDAKADAIIRSDARKIFLGTALAQNGRLDALIVFVALSRMIWRVSKVYNQRPTPAEMWSVYRTAASSSFIAFTIDALDIPRTVTEAMSSLVPAVAPHMATTTVPFMGGAMQCFTSAMLDGAANCLLALRAGIITKNAFRYTMLENKDAKSITAGEIRSAMLTLSKECLGDIVTGLKGQLYGLVGGVADNCVEKTKSACQTVAGTVTSAGGALLRGGESVAVAVGSGAGTAVEAVGEASVSAAKAVISTAESAVGAVGDAAGTVLSTGKNATRKVAAGAGSLFGRLLPGRRDKGKKE